MSDDARRNHFQFRNRDDGVGGADGVLSVAVRRVVDPVAVCVKTPTRLKC